MTTYTTRFLKVIWEETTSPSLVDD